MPKYSLHKTQKKVLADTFTPVSLYLKIRDRFPQALLLESADYHSNANSKSFICFNPIASFKVLHNQLLLQYPGEREVATEITDKKQVLSALNSFSKDFDTSKLEEGFQNGMFGHINYDAVKYFEDIDVGLKPEESKIPDIHLKVFSNVIEINHMKNEAFLYHFSLDGKSDNLRDLEDIITIKSFPKFGFGKVGERVSNYTDDTYKEMVVRAKQHCFGGDVFQIVLSRRFSQSFFGDEFNVYRALRSINPSPYLYYFDYGNYRIFGSSPESQVEITNRKAAISPIAGTVLRTGNDKEDRNRAKLLASDEKENAEHVMLVDLARNDLSVLGENVEVKVNREVQYFSHVIHLVSKVTGDLKEGVSELDVVSKTFPAGTLSGAPKYKAMELIESYENINRQFYGGAIGFISFSGDVNMAIVIRSFLSKENKLHYQAGAGIVSGSTEEGETQEVYNKLAALENAMQLAEEIE